MSATEPDRCPICNAAEWTAKYEGPIRQGEFGRTREAVVYECGRCSVGYLPPGMDDLEAFYGTGRYREQIGQEPDAADYMRRHDRIQLLRTRFLQNVNFRDSVVVDVGCAGGSFLDLISGYAGKTIGVDPATYYAESLEERGHIFYASLNDASEDWSGRADIVTAFDVIEHVEDPVEFLKGIKELLGRGGEAIIATPNWRELLVEEECAEYCSFFYRDVHVFYFEERSLCKAARAAGFKHIEVGYFQEYNFGNFVHWLQQGEPAGNSRLTAVQNDFDEIWRVELERQGLANVLIGFLGL